MELLIGLVALVLVALVVFTLVLLGASGRATAKAKANAPALLDEAFDGRPRATYKINGLAGLDYEDVITGAEDRGYRLTNDSGADRYGNRTMIFTQSSERLT